MQKKIALSIGLLLAPAMWAQTNVHLELTSQDKVEHRSVALENDETASVQFDNLLFEVHANKHESQVDVKLDIFSVTRTEKTAIASPEFSVQPETPAHLSLERDGNQMELVIIVE